MLFRFDKMCESFYTVYLCKTFQRIQIVMIFNMFFHFKVDVIVFYSLVSLRKENKQNLD